MGQLCTFHWAAFGIYNYGIRAISKVKDDKNKINYVFSKLFYISIITSVLTTSIYFLFIYLDNSIENLKELYYILGVQALFQFLYIEWMNEAYENYSFILYKTLVIRIAMLVAIFTFVKLQTISYLMQSSWVQRQFSTIYSVFSGSREKFPLLRLVLSN